MPTLVYSVTHEKQPFQTPMPFVNIWSVLKLIAVVERTESFFQNLVPNLSYITHYKHVIFSLRSRQPFITVCCERKIERPNHWHDISWWNVRPRAIEPKGNGPYLRRVFFSLMRVTWLIIRWSGAINKAPMYEDERACFTDGCLSSWWNGCNANAQGCSRGNTYVINNILN